MSNPQYTDPNRDPNLDPNRRDPLVKNTVVHPEKSSNGAWGWIAGIAVVVLIAFVLLGGWGSSNDTAGVVDPPAATVTGSPAPSPTTPMPPATTGQGNSNMQPTTPPAAAPAPAPVTPAPANRQ